MLLRVSLSVYDSISVSVYVCVFVRGVCADETGFDLTGFNQTGYVSHNIGEERRGAALHMKERGGRGEKEGG